MSEKRDYTPHAPAATEKSSLLSTFEAHEKFDAPPQPAAAAVNTPSAPPPARSAAALDEEILILDFIARLGHASVSPYIPLPGTRHTIRRPPQAQSATGSHIPVISTEEATMGQSLPPRTGVMVTALAGLALLWFVLAAARGPIEFGANRMGDQRQVAASGGAAEAMAGKRLVPLEAHIMSKCPDTKACLQELVLPAMERVSAKVDFTLSFLGRPTANDGVECMHGAPECLGNILLLCAAHYYPTPLALPFAMCLENDYQNIPNEELVRQCALEHAVDFEKLNECASDQDTALGLKLLRDSVERSITLQVRKSCTVRLAGEVYCIHDGDWKECPKGPGVNDLVVEIEKLYNNQNF